LKKYATISLSKEYLKFSAGHFTIFSATERERLHGHNFAVTASFHAPVDDRGLCFNYGDVKRKVANICESLDEYLLLPGQSAFLQIEESENYYLVQFNDEKMQFLRSDTLILPLRNISVEELADYILSRVLADPEIQQAQIDQIEVGVSSGPGQWGKRCWSLEMSRSHAAHTSH
jgi:6-pyruvoyltetrahydropterin/6-carboxytetrahydropterin synthase